MRLKFLLSITIMFLSVNIIAQEIILDGIYNGKNLYVLNPDAENGFCVKEVKVNGKSTKDELFSNSFEIDFSQMNIEKGMKVHVQIIHQSSCSPKIINPEILTGKPAFHFDNTKVNRKGFLCWDISGNQEEGVFLVEQFRWNKWVKAGELRSVDTVNANKYSIEISPNTSQNLFRIKFTDNQGNSTISREIKYILPGKEITIIDAKVKDRIAFTSVTMFEIIDESGNLILNGNDKYIDTSVIPKGKYFINYDNKTEAYTKK